MRLFCGIILKTFNESRSLVYDEAGAADFNIRREIIMRIRKDKQELLEEEVLLIANVSDALAHPARIKLFKYVMNRNQERVAVCNKDLVENFPYAQATISQHMEKLVISGLVEKKRQDKFTYYYANLGMLSRYLNATRKFSIE